MIPSLLTTSAFIFPPRIGLLCTSPTEVTRGCLSLCFKGIHWYPVWLQKGHLKEREKKRQLLWLQNHFETRGNYASVTKQICHKSLYKRTAGREPKRWAGSHSPSICSGDSALLLPCSVSNWHSDPSDNSTSATRGPLRSPLFPQAEFKGLFADTHRFMRAIVRASPGLNGDTTFAGQHGKRSHPRILTQYSTDEKLRMAKGEGYTTKPLSFTSSVSNLRRQSTQLF